MRLATTPCWCSIMLALAACLGLGCAASGDPGASPALAPKGFTIHAEINPADSHLGSAKLQLAQIALPAPAPGLCLEVTASEVYNLRGTYFYVSYNSAQYDWNYAQSGAALRQCAAPEPLLELYVLSRPGVVACGQLLPNWDRRPGLSGDCVLARLYFTYRAGQAEPRQVCQPPDLDRSKPTLEFNGSNLLSWRFYNQGDYNQNGSVGLTDLTPLGMRFGASVSYPAQLDTAQAVVDGNGDGVLNLADVMPLGVNFGKNIGHGWQVYSSASTADYPLHWNDGNGAAAWLGTVDVGSYDPLTSPATDRLRYNFTLAAPVPGDIYWVRPADGAGAEGIASNYAPAGNNSPYAVFTTHGGAGSGLAGTAPHCVYFDASASFDPDGNPIVSYGWDFESDGTVDDTTATPLHTFTMPGSYSVKLVVSDGTAPGEDTQVVQVNDPGTWHVYTLDALDDAGQYCSLAAIGGLPAVAYRQTSAPNTVMCYMQSSSPLGAPGTWSVPVNAAVGDIRGISLLEVNSLPAAAYYDATAAPQFLAYTRYDGMSWLPGAPRDSDNDAGAYCNLLVYGGVPRICYYRATPSGDGELRLLSAGDAVGSNWPNPPVLLDGFLGYDVGQFASAVARPDGIGAAYFNAGSQHLQYVRSNDPALLGFTGRYVDNRAGWTTGRGASLAFADGNPCIAYHSTTAGPPAQDELNFIRATDAQGDIWPAGPDQVAFLGTDDLSLAIIDGQPAVAMRTVSGALMYRRSYTYTGFSSSESMLVDNPTSVDVGRHVRLVEINGLPCIAYYDDTNKDLKFAIRY